jgi:hypothetical protein
VDALDEALALEAAHPRHRRGQQVVRGPIHVGPRLDATSSVSRQCDIFDFFTRVKRTRPSREERRRFPVPFPVPNPASRVEQDTCRKRRLSDAR